MMSPAQRCPPSVEVKPPPPDTCPSCGSAPDAELNANTGAGYTAWACGTFRDGRRTFPAAQCRIRVLEAEVAVREGRCAEWLRRITAPIVCLCGSTRFMGAYNEARKELTRRGIIVLSVEIVTTQSRDEDPQHCDPELKARLDELHKRKIDLADAVFVLDVGGYVGKSTQGEIDYATALGKPLARLTEYARGEGDELDGDLDAADWFGASAFIHDAALACPDLAASRLLAEAKVGRLAMDVRAASLDLRDTAPDIMNTAHSQLWAECIAAMREAREAKAAEEAGNGQ